jgi:hypothetical protein
VTEKELINQVVTLAENCKKDHPMIAGVLFHLAGSITAGPEWLRRTFDLTTQESARFIQLMTGENEPRN